MGSDLPESRAILGLMLRIAEHLDAIDARVARMEERLAERAQRPAAPKPPFGETKATASAEAAIAKLMMGKKDCANKPGHQPR